MCQFTLANSQHLKTSLNKIHLMLYSCNIAKVHLYFLNQSQLFNIPIFSKRRRGDSIVQQNVLCLLHTRSLVSTTFTILVSCLKKWSHKISKPRSRHYYILCLFAKGQTKNLKGLRRKNKKPEGFAK
jgi:hypothetical protein